jgi:hypothetical protein
MDKLEVFMDGDWTTPESKKLKDAYDKAVAGQHKLSDFVRWIPGMSGYNYRYLINNLMETVDDARYLEIGSWKGSTACSAMYGNTCKVVCVDNWAEFFRGSHAKADFHTNTEAVVTDAVDFHFIEDDFRKLDHSTLGKFNVYLFDGPHEEQDQYDGLALMLDVLDDTFTFIVDDWNDVDRVQAGTKRALAEFNLEVVAKIEILYNSPVDCENSPWHNGYFIAVVKKPQVK